MASLASSWARWVSSTFPLATFDAVPVRHPQAGEKRTKPVLFVAEGHPTLKQKQRQGEDPSSSSQTGWASRDPRCLAWQMQFVFRGIDVDSKQTSTPDDFTLPGYPGEGFTRVPVLLDVDGTVVGRRHLVRWADHVQPKSDEEKPSRPANSSLAKQCESLLRGPIMAGVLLELLLLPDRKSEHVGAPLLSRQVQRRLRYQRKCQLAAQIVALVPQSPTSRVPQWITSIDGLLNAGQGSFLDTGTAADFDEEEQAHGVPLFADPDGLDVAAVRKAACEAIKVLSVLVLDEAGAEWACLASGPSKLDALLFAQLHTIMSLPVDDITAARPTKEESLRQAVLDAPNLLAYSRRVWQQFVKPRGG